MVTLIEMVGHCHILAHSVSVFFLLLFEMAISAGDFHPFLLFEIAMTGHCHFF